MNRPRIYLAGPDVFYADAALRFEILKRLCAQYGLDGVSPLDGAPETTKDASGARALVEHNIAILSGCDGVLANLTPFHGLEPDSGTSFEVGFAAAIGKPVAAYTADNRTTAERALQADLTDGTEPEPFGQMVNAMLSVSAAVFVRPVAALEFLRDACAMRQPGATATESAAA